MSFGRDASPPSTDFMARGVDFFTALSSFIATLTSRVDHYTSEQDALRLKEQLTTLALKNIVFSNLVQNEPSIQKDYVSLEQRAAYVEKTLSLEPTHPPIIINESALALSRFLKDAPLQNLEKISESAACLLNDDPSSSGSFYTPAALCDEIIERMFVRIDSIRAPLHILEPSCGSGAFMLSMLKKIHLSKIASLTIIDKNPLALEVTRLLIKCFCYIQKLPPPLTHFYHDDFILPHHNNWTSRNYDIIVGNPPFGLSRSGGFTPDELRIIKEVYRETTCGKPNKYLLFLAQAVKHLSPQGVLSFITPNAWLGIDGGKKIREFIIQNKRLYSITKLPRETWKKLGVETVVVTLLGSENKYDHFEIYDQANRQSTSTSYIKFRNRTITLHVDEAKEHILNEIIKNGVQLKNLHQDFFLAVGIQAYRTGGGIPTQTKETLKLHPYHAPYQKNEEWLPYLEGKNVSRNGITTPQSFIHYGTHLAECPLISRFTRPRILIREVLGKPPNLLIATPVQQCYIYNRSILEIAPLGQHAWQTAQWLAALLNSPYGSIQIELLGKKSQRALFPKIVLSDLKEFYLPLSWKDLVAQYDSSQELISPITSSY